VGHVLSREQACPTSAHSTDVASSSCIGRREHIIFRYAYRHKPPRAVLDLISFSYPTLEIGKCKYNTVNVLNNTVSHSVTDELPLDPHALAQHAQAAAAAFIAAGTAANTVRSYRSALAYWPAWLQLRYGQRLGDAAVPSAVAIQFVPDHLAPTVDGGWPHMLSANVDSALFASRAGRARRNSQYWRPCRAMPARRTACKWVTCAG
jgi:hypothetical protein